MHHHESSTQWTRPTYKRTRLAKLARLEAERFVKSHGRVLTRAVVYHARHAADPRRGRNGDDVPVVGFEHGGKDLAITRVGHEVSWQSRREACVAMIQKGAAVCEWQMQFTMRTKNY